LSVCEGEGGLGRLGCRLAEDRAQHAGLEVDPALHLHDAAVRVADAGDLVALVLGELLPGLLLPMRVLGPCRRELRLDRGADLGGLGVAGLLQRPAGCLVLLPGLRAGFTVAAGEGASRLGEALVVQLLHRAQSQLDLGALARAEVRRELRLEEVRVDQLVVELLAGSTLIDRGIVHGAGFLALGDGDLAGFARGAADVFVDVLAFGSDMDLRGALDTLRLKGAAVDAGIDTGAGQVLVTYLLPQRPKLFGRTLLAGLQVPLAGMRIAIDDDQVQVRIARVLAGGMDRAEVGDAALGQLGGEVARERQALLRVELDRQRDDQLVADTGVLPALGLVLLHPGTGLVAVRGDQVGDDLRDGLLARDVADVRASGAGCVRLLSDRTVIQAVDRHG